MATTRRERIRAATIIEIKEIARRHMSEKGAVVVSPPSLMLTAIGRWQARRNTL